MTAIQRKAIIAEAESWLRTPYRPNASVKGAGADCAMMPLAVYRSVLNLPLVDLPDYQMQWHLHRNAELYLDIVRALGAVEVAEPQPGDFAIWKLGRVYSHGAIVTAWPEIIHAVNPRGVVRGNALTDELVMNRTPLFFTFVGS